MFYSIFLFFSLLLTFNFELEFGSTGESGEENFRFVVGNWLCFTAMWGIVLLRFQCSVSSLVSTFGCLLSFSLSKLCCRCPVLFRLLCVAWRECIVPLATTMPFSYGHQQQQPTNLSTALGMQIAAAPISIAAVSAARLYVLLLLVVVVVVPSSS